MSHEGHPSPVSAPRETHRPARSEVQATTLLAVSDGSAVSRDDWIAIEEPLEIRAHGPEQAPVSVAVTMRTPGNDEELAVGFLFTEGLVRTKDEILAADERRAGSRGGKCNIVQVALTGAFDDGSLKRNFFATSSCGICGKATLEQVAVRVEPVADDVSVHQSVIVALPGQLREAQAVFERTGGLHAAGLFDGAGQLQIVREDVGRHNAVDKLVGRALLDGMVPLSRGILLVSGRTSFEILQKAAVAGVPIVCAVSAPSSLAVSLADRLGITLIGFLRGDHFNIYTHPHRIALTR